MTRSRNSRRTAISCGPACESALRTAFCETSTAASAQRPAASRARRSRNGHRTTAASRRSGHQRRSWIRAPAWGDRDRDWRSCAAGSASRAWVRFTKRAVRIPGPERAWPRDRKELSSRKERKKEKARVGKRTRPEQPQKAQKAHRRMAEIDSVALSTRSTFRSSSMRFLRFFAAAPLSSSPPT